MRKILIIFAAAALSLTLQAQRPIAYHSHNDYNRTAPFWEAYSQHCTSIEADVFLHDGEILVAHNREDVSADRSLRTMYIEPIVKKFRENGGRMWKGSDDLLQLVVDLKSSDALPGVVALAEEFPDVVIDFEICHGIGSGTLPYRVLIHVLNPCHPVKIPG